jgi:hypothetical protein
MAFNFNWSPLTADASFYQRARDLLTTALNKSPKPPIIVDDILVTELNLGTVPPELEILEIGDLAEDRFRGIFKMCYSGDAYLTLRTRVQVCDIILFDTSIKGARLDTFSRASPGFTAQGAPLGRLSLSMIGQFPQVISARVDSGLFRVCSLITSHKASALSLGLPCPTAAVSLFARCNRSCYTAVAAASDRCKAPRIPLLFASFPVALVELRMNARNWSHRDSRFLQ